MEYERKGLESDRHNLVEKLLAKVHEFKQTVYWREVEVNLMLLLLAETARCPLTTGIDKHQEAPVQIYISMQRKPVEETRASLEIVNEFFNDELVPLIDEHCLKDPCPSQEKNHIFGMFLKTLADNYSQRLQSERARSFLSVGIH